MSREREAFFSKRSSSCTVEGGEEEEAPLPLETQAKMAALGAYPMSWERFYQLEHDGPWARGLTGIRAGSLTCTATYPACEKNRFSLSLDLRWRPLVVLPGIWSTTEIRSAAWRVFLSSSYGNSHPVDTIPVDIPGNETIFLRSPSIFPDLLISRSSKIFASFVRNAYVKEKRRKRKKERYSSIFPYPANLASFHFCHRCGRGVDRSRREKPLPSFVLRPSFFLPRANKNANFETKRNELTKSIKLEYQRARS